MCRVFRLPAVLLACELGLAIPVCAQAVSGTIAGTITDAQSAVLPGVTVTVRNVETGTSRTIASDGAGAYQVRGLPAGRYDMKADLPGFAAVLVKDLTLAIGSELRRDFTMGLSAVEES